MTLLYRSALTLTALAALGLTATAHAQTTQFSDRASFNAAASGLTTFTFDGYAPKNSTSTDFNFMAYPNGLTVKGVGFTATASKGVLYVDDPSDGNGNLFGDHQYLDTDSEGLGVALPAGTTAFGADFSNFYGTSGATLTALVNGVTFTFTAPAGYGSAAGTAFAGFTSSAPITSLSFSGGTFGIAIDNVSFGKAGIPAPAVPEPSAPVSLGVGVLGLAGLAAARRRKQAASGL